MSDNHLVDKRIVKRNIEKGLLSRKDHQKYLKDLPDASDNMDVVDIGADEREADEGSSES